MSQRFLSGVAVVALTMGLAACNGGSEGPVTTPPPEIDIGQSDNGGAEPSEGGGGEVDGGDTNADGASDGGGDGDGSTEAAPDIPAPDPADYPGMDEETPEGAEQAFKYFWDVAIRGFQGGDHRELALMSVEDCENCNSLIGQIQDLKDRGEYWSGFSTSEVNLVAEDGGQDYDYIVEYSFIIPEHTEPSVEVGEPEEWGVITYSTRGGIVWDSGRWKIVDFSSDYEEGAEGS